MLKGLATWFLNNYLGKYLENLNTDQLTIALLQGEVELENVPLRRDALRFLDSSLEVYAGFVGHIKLKIPVVKLRSEPWTILLEKVYIVVGPQKFEDYDEDLDEQVLLEKKLLSLDGIEAEWRELEDSETTDSYESWKSQGTSFIATILDNLQIKIEDVHIRYEDETVSRPFACGFTLDTLAVQTCDENWLPKFIYRDSKQVHAYKIAQLQNMAVYFQADVEMYGHLDMKTLSEKMFFANRQSYLLKPVCATATIKRNCHLRPLNSQKTPRLAVDLKLGSIPLEISDSQYACALLGLRAFHQLRKNRRVWKWRPHNPVINHAKEWWQYAITCHMERIHQRNQRYTWTAILQRAKENVEYVKAFKQYLNNPVGISPELKNRKDSLDSCRSYQELKVLRDIAVLHLKKERYKDTKEKRKLSWYEWWYGIDPSSVQPESGPVMSPIEEEIVDAFNIGGGEMYKDAIFLQINFSLESGSLRLCSTNHLDQKTVDIFELEFDKMMMQLESRPRTKSYKFELSLGALYLRDRISTEASMFPILVSPANVKGAPLYPQRNRSFKSAFQTFIGCPEQTPPSSHLFSLYVETNPSPQVDMKIVCRSEALNIVYNPIVLHCVTDFFKIPEELNKTSDLSEKIRHAALTTIEEAKQRTKEELKKNLNSIFDYDVHDADYSILSKKVWDISIELSAPQFLIPESFVDKSALILVVDFGKLHISNADLSLVEEKKTDSDDNDVVVDDDDDEDEDEFLTPASTPEELPTTTSDASIAMENLNSSKFYDRLTICLSDMQVIISKIKDNWKNAHLKGTSSLHVLDKFSITLQLEKRNVYTSDSDYPNIVVAGTLPRLSVHINEEKVLSFQRMSNLLRGDYDLGKHSSNCQDAGVQTNDEPFGRIESNVSSWEPKSNADESSKLLVMYFCINDMSVELQSQGKSIAELQVTGVKTSYTRRPFDSNISMSVHSLLLVDALQTFGPNFELLVASHRHVTVDSVSGSLKGSEPVSPKSPTSPDYNRLSQNDASPMDIRKALSSLQRDRGIYLKKANTSMFTPIDTVDPDALIAIDIHFLGLGNDGNEQKSIISIQFNSLDVIANQETIIELIAFMKRISPVAQITASRRRFPLKDASTQTIECAINSSSYSQEMDDTGQLDESVVKRKTTELTAEFQRLNVLLLRAVTGKMIGTALLTEVQLVSTIRDTAFSVSGSLGGLQIMNLLSGSMLHQRILSVGKDPSTTDSITVYPDLYPGSYDEEKRAFTFDLLHTTTTQNGATASVNLQVRMASVCYIHSSTFLNELNSCATDFKQYMANLASSIRNAATEMALGIVHRRAEAMAHYYYHRDETIRFSRYDSLDRAQNKGGFAPASTPKIARSCQDFDLHLDVVMETPIIVLPRHERSFEVLVAHLGEIVVLNESGMQKYVVQVKDMNVHSINLRKKYRSADPLNAMSYFKHLTAQEMYSCHSPISIPILHDTAIDLTIGKQIAHSESSQSFTFHDEIPDRFRCQQEVYNVRGRVKNALKISLYRSQYEQILDSLKSSSSSSKSTNKRESSEMEAEWDDDSNSSSNTAIMEGSFEIPNLVLELRGDMISSDKKEQVLVSVTFQDFAIYYERNVHTTLDIALKSLEMEDLLSENDSHHRKLMTSVGTGLENTLSTSKLSTSCPELWPPPPPPSSMSHFSSSLPTRLNAETILFGIPPNKIVTPPPTICSSSSSSSSLISGSRRDFRDVNDHLVRIKILNVDSRSQDYLHKYKCIDRFVDVDFNTLDIIVNLQTWVIVLDFFGIGSCPSPEPSETIAPRSRLEQYQRQKQQINSEMDIKVKSLSVLLNKPEYELAKLSVSNFVSKMSLRKGNFSIDGCLGGFSLKDLTPNGRLYNDRFLSRGGNSTQVLRFSLFKYDLSDPQMNRPCDVTLKVEMASIIYVHTHRFYTEFVAFLMQFHQLQGVMNRIREAAAGSIINKMTSRGSRIKLDINIGSPILFLPMSSFSKQILVVDLGHLEVSNKFCFAGEPGTISSETLVTSTLSEIIGRRRSRAPSASSQSSRRSRASKSNSRTDLRRQSSDISTADDEPINDIIVNEVHKCLLDVAHISLKSMDLRIGDRLSAFTEEASLTSDDISAGGFIVRLNSKRLMKEKFELQLQMERNLDKAFCHRVPDVSVKGTLSTVHAVIDSDQYKIIRGLLSYNLGETIEDMNMSVPTGEYQDPAARTVISGNVWTGMFINIELQDVVLDLLKDKLTLARINFFKSRLIYESFCDGSKDVDLVSQEISLSDCRFDGLPAEDRSNVFPYILEPMKKNGSSSSSSFYNSGALLQAEVHYRSTSEINRFTILLNNMRLMGIFDWWTTVLQFISLCPDKPAEFHNDAQSTHADPSRFHIVYMREEPLYPTTGIISRRAPVVEAAGPVFELKLNITDSEVVAVADASKINSPAVILRSTTVLAFRPDMTERPFSCNLNSAEVFSCVLGNENDDESALSIIDPVTINFEIGGRPTVAKGLNDLNLDDSHTDRTAELQLQQLNLRLSYHDWIMFSYILNSFPRQAKAAMHQECSKLSSNISDEDDEEEEEKENGNERFLGNTRLSFSSFELKTSSVNICIIDDCMDADIPLIELSFNRLHLKQDFLHNGMASCLMNGSYYNRGLSSWEPFLEPWKCNLSWNVAGLNKKFTLNVNSDDIVNLNITTSLLDLYRIVTTNWTQDYYDNDDTLRRRVPFVPFALKNETWCNLWFCTQTHLSSLESQFFKPNSDIQFQEQSWKHVLPGETVPFSFEERGKLRHLNSRDIKVHQLITRVEGWSEVCPVSIDRVGTYFRTANASVASSEKSPPARIVFEVALEGSARKLIIVRSALLVSNKLSYPIQLKLKNTAIKIDDTLEIVLSPGATRPIPLNYVWATIYCRQADGQWKYSEKPINWYHILTSHDNSLDMHQCFKSKSETLRFCVAIQRLNYPTESHSISSSWIQPAHKITFASPVKIINLLPYPLILHHKNGTVKETIIPGKETNLSVDISEQNILTFSLEQFPKGSDVLLPSNVTSNFEVQVRVMDSKERPLYLTAQVTCHFGGIAKISIFSPFWIVNKTGLPLLFKQESSEQVAAGQEDAHEVARMTAPLLFSFSEEGNQSLTMRIGTGLHPEGRPQWCKHFYIQQQGCRVRRLRVSPKEHFCVEKVYIIGMDIRSGKGRYDRTLIVTLTPRFQIHNRSPYKIQIAQKCFVSSFHNPDAENTYLQSPPQSSLSFHWPRVDKDQLLCIKLLNVPQCMWSGGFEIEIPNSFPLMVRDEKNKVTNIRVEIGVVGATFSILFASGDKFPPPFRIDNFSEVPITYFQTGVPDIRTCIKANQSSTYALDEPTLLPHLTCEAPGGSSATYNLNALGEGSQLFYENFIYIALTCTVLENNAYPELVLDVEGTKVVLAFKLEGKRSQLWTMTASGLLQHEGSSAPQDPRNPTPRNQALVLDIAGPAVQPTAFVPLTLRKADERRRLTQRWRFSSKGKLCCEHKGLYAQTKYNAEPGSEVVLGPSESDSSGVPLGQGFCRQRLRPGSGVLSLRVITDGPTRVLQIMDAIKHDKVSDESKLKKVSSNFFEFSVGIKLRQGIGLSLVSADPPEELCYALLSNIVVEYSVRNNAVILDGSVQSLQIDNQLFNCQSPVVLFLSPSTKSDEYRHMPAIHFTAAKQTSSVYIDNAEIFDHMILTMKNVTLDLEEELICKVLKCTGLVSLSDSMPTGTIDNLVQETTFEQNQEALIMNTITATRYYFGTLKITLNQVKLSVLKSNKLSPDLKAVRRKMNLSLITFEDANIELDPYVRVHPFETVSFLVNSILKHYHDELLSQAVLILGSTDFLGNPIGFLNDLSEGVTGFVSEGNVGGLIKNVAHGAANSAAKVTGSLSYGISKLSLVEKYDERRLMLHKRRGDKSKEHLMAGLKGLGFGVLGGLTSVVSETYEGVANDGIGGFFTGLGWGLIGTISKPAVGVLDLATGAATAVRESSRSTSKQRPTQIRVARLVLGPGGKMPIYSAKDALGQEKMWRMNGYNGNEIYMANETLTHHSQDNFEVLISSERTMVYTRSTDNVIKLILSVYHGELVSARCMSSTSESDRYFVELTISPNAASDSGKRPQVRCDNEKIARDVAQKINYAKSMFEELRQALSCDMLDNMDNDL